MKVYVDKIEWRLDALKKYQYLTYKMTSRNIMLYSKGKLVAVYDRSKNEGKIF